MNTQTVRTEREGSQYFTFGELGTASNVTTVVGLPESSIDSNTLAAAWKAVRNSTAALAAAGFLVIGAPAITSLDRGLRFEIANTWTGHFGFQRRRRISLLEARRLALAALQRAELLRAEGIAEEARRQSIVESWS